MLILMLMLKDCVSDFIMRNSCVVFCLFFSVLSVSSEKRSRIRFYPDDTNTTCLGIVCPRNFIFVPCTFGDGKKDTCVGCPLDRPISVEKFNSALFSEPPDNICKDPDEICVCPDEAKLMNPEECLNNLNPKCQCDVSKDYIGSDPKLCKLSENRCSSTGVELALNGSCVKCSDDKYKDQIGYGKCEKQPKCEHPYVVNQQGDFRTRRTCKLQPTVNTPFPGKKTFVSNSVPTTDKGYTSIPTSSVTVNDTSTNSTSGEEPSSDENLIWIVVIGGLISITVMTVVIIFKRRSRREDGDVENPGFLKQFRNKFCIRSNTLNLSLSIELKKIEQSNSSGKDWQKKSEETDSLLQYGDNNILQSRRTSESGNSFKGAEISIGPSASPFDDVPKSPSEDTVLKKEISSEDTNVKTSEPESTSNVPNLHVDSMLSGGNTSSSGPSDVYCLQWQSPGDDRPRIGRIEYMYWDNQLHCLKSGVLTDLVSGKVLLEVPLNETKKYMTRFVVYIVPDNGNGGIEPFRQVQLEHLEDEIDINSLKKSGATVLNLESFEIIDLQRPEENSAHFGQPSSEQPHHMPLPHAQNQSDSGIDNNTGNNEVQNEGTYNSLCLGSFENDN